MIMGYTSGVYDLFHIGHLNLLRNAKSMCDKLIVGVTTDELVKYKKSKAVIPFEERMEIVRSIEYVDAVVAQEDMNKYEIWKKLTFDIMFVGDDWYESDKWNSIEEKLNDVNVRVVYFPYTKGTSSTLINKTLLNIRSNK